MAERNIVERTGLGQSEYHIARGRLDRWLQDSELVAQEADEAISSAKDSLVVEDCLTEFDNHLRSMSPEDHQTALDGLRWYAEHFQEDS